MFHFRQNHLIGEEKLQQIIDKICWCLEDKVVEVREMASRSVCFPNHVNVAYVLISSLTGYCQTFSDY